MSIRPTVKMLVLWVLAFVVVAAPSSFLAQVAIAPPTHVRMVANTTTAGGPLVQLGNLLYQGAFRVPRGAFGDPHGDGFNYPDSGLTFNATNGSLFINGHVYWQMTAEISIPAVVNSTSLGSLNTATVLQNLNDAAEGNRAEILVNGAPTRNALMGGLLVYNNKLIGTSYEYYDATNDTRLSHFTSTLNLSQTSDFRGMYVVGDSTKTGFVSGYMAVIPVEWRAPLGGPALTGNCCISIMARTSWGPAASVFDPDGLGVVNPVSATPLVEYPSTNPLARYVDGVANTKFEAGDEMRGLVFPSNTRSVLFFGRHGMGKFCYGEGTTTQSLDHTMVAGQTDPSVIYCYDPIYTSKGSHSYPYNHYVWAYDANDLLDVKAGRKSSWEIQPYGLWTLPLPTTFGIPGYAGIQGAAYDPATQRIYVSQKHGDANLPLIHVFKVQIP